MSDAFYNVVWTVCAPAFLVSGSPTVIGIEHTRRDGAFILAANHQCAYDVPLLMLHVRRKIDFVSIVEVFRKPLVGWFYGSLNAFPLDRSKPDSPTVRVILDRLTRGRVVGMFPEGRFRTGAASMVHTRQIKPGIARIAQLAGVPIVPCAIIGSPAYSKFKSWLPRKRTRYGLAFGKPIRPEGEPSSIELKLSDAIASLHGELAGRLGFGIEAQ
jgi:1-acyl-sn-glycerol-3-phosphate acyltransferase